MRLYLIQHAEAKSKEENPSRPLSEKGLKDIKKVAKYAQRNLRIQVAEIVHSGKLRAVQTANVLAEHLKPTKGPTTSKDLEPLANPGIWKNRLAETTKDIILVGHLPHLSKLSGLLLAGNEDNEIIEFRMGVIVCLERDESGRWSTKWMITPEILP
jgi:phosphohistidine phosphatase